MKVSVTFEQGTGGPVRSEDGTLLGENGANRRVVEIDTASGYLAIPLHRVIRIDEIR